MQEFVEAVSVITAAIILVVVIVANAKYDKNDSKCDPKECSTCPFPCEQRDQNKGE